MIDYEFADKSILELALRHRSAGKENNERLEFLGDSILGFIIAEELYSRFPTASEGELSRLRATLVQENSLADVAREQNITSSIILGKGEQKSGGANRESILADTVEALISAIYLDAGLEVCREQVLQWFSKSLNKLDLKTSQKDAKTRLQEHLQALQQQLPVYKIIDVTGKDHEQIFSVSCEIQILKNPVIAKGNSKREAEQIAAELALNSLGI